MKPLFTRVSSIQRLLPRRPATSQKQDFGHVLIVAGSRGMTGAAYLSALGALKAGAGLVTVAGVRPVCDLIRRKLPEAMTIDLRTLYPYIRKRKINALGVGPGLSVGASPRRLVRSLLRLRLPTVVDADGLNNLTPRELAKSPVVITPHAGEFARLTGKTRAQVEKNRAGVAAQLARILRGVCLLKGHRTVITDGRRTVLNPTGSSAMASGGMGDVLTGVISALLAQGLPLFEAAQVGAYVHGLAGDIARESDRGLLASELALAIPKAFRKLGRT